MQISITIEGQEGLTWPLWKRFVTEIENLDYFALTTFLSTKRRWNWSFHWLIWHCYPSRMRKPIGYSPPYPRKGEASAGNSCPRMGTDQITRMLVKRFFA